LKIVGNQTVLVTIEVIEVWNILSVNFIQLQ